MDYTKKIFGRSEAKTANVMNCVWMDAGVVDYKLCDRSYDCERCPFDESLHGEHRELRFREESFHVQGCEVAKDLFYHPSTHMWMRIEENGHVRLGVDDFGQRLLGAAYSLTLPAEESCIKNGESCCRLTLQCGVVSLCSPVSGKVGKTNSSLRLRPSLLNRDPYGSGWMVLVEPIDLEASLKRSFYGSRVGTWLGNEADKLNLLISSLTNYEPTMPITMNDGGLLTKEFLKGLTVEQARRVISTFFPLATDEAEHTAIVVHDGR